MFSTALLFVATLLLLVVVHEFGHYAVARLFGVDVTRVSLGFGRVIYRLPTAGETEWVVSAIPLGGYIKLKGESREEAGGPGAMFTRPLWQRTAIVAAGPLANFALAFALYAVQAWAGTIEPAAVLSTPPVHSLAAEAGLKAKDQITFTSTDGSRWESVHSMLDLHWAATAAVLRADPLYLRAVRLTDGTNSTVRLATDQLQAKDVGHSMLRQVGIAAPFGAGPARIEAVTPGGGAHAAGVIPGDRVVAIDGRRLVDADDLLATIQAAGTDDRPTLQSWTIAREGGHLLQLQVRASMHTANGISSPRVGVVIAGRPEISEIRFDLVEGLRRAFVRTVDNAALTFRLVQRMVLGQASTRNIAGPVSSAQTAGQAATLGFAAFLSFVAMLSVGMGALNLLPLPLLDGGHLLQYGIEALTRRPLSALSIQVLQRGGAVLIVLITALALYNDALRVVGAA